VAPINSPELQSLSGTMGPSQNSTNVYVAPMRRSSQGNNGAMVKVAPMMMMHGVSSASLSAPSSVVGHHDDDGACGDDSDVVGAGDGDDILPIIS
jgi:hypothetical protein